MLTKICQCRSFIIQIDIFFIIDDGYFFIDIVPTLVHIYLPLNIYISIRKCPWHNGKNVGVSRHTHHINQSHRCNCGWTSRSLFLNIMEMAKKIRLMRKNFINKLTYFKLFIKIIYIVNNCIYILCQQCKDC